MVRTKASQQVKRLVEDWPRRSIGDPIIPYVGGRNGTRSRGLACWTFNQTSIMKKARKSSKCTQSASPVALFQKMHPATFALAFSVRLWGLVPHHFHALEKEMAPTPVFLPGESQGWGSLVGAVYGVAQSRTRLKRLSSSNNVTKFCTSSSHLSVLSYSYLLPCLFSSPGMIAWVYESGFTQTLGPREIFLELWAQQVHNKHFLQGGCGVRS